VDRYAQVMVRCNQYSAPARFIGHRLRVKLSASTVTVFDRTTVVARHQRATGKGVKLLELDHYLEILLRKPMRCPGRPRSPRLARRARSRRRMTRSGPRPGSHSATPPAPA
jgi:Mu transposase, C-terminal domain